MRSSLLSHSHDLSHQKIQYWLNDKKTFFSIVEFFCGFRESKQGQTGLRCLVRVSQQNYFTLSSIRSGESIEVSVSLLYNEQLKPFS
jgi:hypothetical protein